MKKKLVVYSLLFLLLYFLNIVFVPIRVFGISPEFVFIGVICLAMLENERFGAVFGLLFGLLCDFPSSGVFGMKALLFMAVGYITGFLTEKFISVNFFGALFLSVVHTALCGVLTCALYAFFTGEEFVSSLFYTALPKVILSVPTAAVLYFVFRIARHFITRRGEREGTW